MTIKPTERIPFTLANVATDFASGISVGAQQLKAGDAFVGKAPSIPSRVGFGNAFLDNVEAPELAAVADFEMSTSNQGNALRNIADFSAGTFRAIFTAPEAGMRGLNTAFAAPTVACAHVLSDPNASTGMKLLAGVGAIASLPLAFAAMFFKALSMIFRFTTSYVGQGADWLIHRPDRPVGAIKYDLSQFVDIAARAGTRQQVTEYVRNSAPQ